MVCLGAYASLQISMITYRETGVVEGVYSPSLGCRLMLSLYFFNTSKSAGVQCKYSLPFTSPHHHRCNRFFSYLKDTIETYYLNA